MVFVNGASTRRRYSATIFADRRYVAKLRKEIPQRRPAIFLTVFSPPPQRVGWNYAEFHHI
jgi:hypothetical protein